MEQHPDLSDLPPDLPLPLQQSPEYARALEGLGLTVRRGQRERNGRISLSWQTQARRFGRFGTVELISRGPVAHRPQDLQDWLFHSRLLHSGRPVLLNPDGIARADLRRAGFWPLITPTSVALLRLGPVADMRSRMAQKWRNRLNRAQNAGLKLSRHTPDPSHWLFAADTAQARQKGYRSLPPALSLSFAKANPGKARIYEIRKDGDPLAATLILRHGVMATWQIGHITEKGRKFNAMNLALFSAMQELAEQGHHILDLGLLNTQDSPGLARFKLGTGARAHQLGGSWLRHNALAPLARRLPQRLAA
jgi:hypothetical protein